MIRIKMEVTAMRVSLIQMGGGNDRDESSVGSKFGFDIS